MKDNDNLEIIMKMIDSGAINPLGTSIKTDQVKNKNLFKNIISDIEKKEKAAAGNFSLNLGQFAQVFLQLFRVFAHFFALPSEMLLHHRYGIRAIEPIGLFSRFLLSFMALMIAGSFVIGFVVMALAFSQLNDAIMNNGAGMMRQSQNLFKIDWSMIFVPIIFSIVLYWAHFISVKIFYWKGGARESWSTGSPWIYTLTRVKFFISPYYILLIQPVIFICFSVVLYNYNELMFALFKAPPNSVYYSSVIPAFGLFFLISSISWFLRSLGDYHSLKNADLDREDQTITSKYLEALQAFNSDRIDEALDQAAEKYAQGEEVPKEIVNVLAERGKIEKPTFQ